MSLKKTIVLFFTVGSNPTDEEMAEMNTIPGARQRNASLIIPEAAPEKCDFVAGPAIPESYERFPHYSAEAASAAKPKRTKVDPETSASGGAVGGEGDAGGKKPAKVDPNELSNAELKAALTEAGVAFKGNASKAALVGLYEANIK